MIANLFLDFLNRDSREIYGLYKNTPRESHIHVLTEALNVAAFLAAEYCILPPGFIAECAIGRDAILRRADYVIERLIRFPLREETLEEFWDKKRREYAPYRQKYAGLFNHQNETLLRRFSRAIVTRNSKVADEILRTWDVGPDMSPRWATTTPFFSGREIELIRHVPREIRDDGVAVTWAAIHSRVKQMRIGDAPRLRHLLQNHYFNVYVFEYGLSVVSRLPFVRVPFLDSGKDLTNDYEALKYALAALDVWTVISNLSAESLITLRSKAGYYEFRRLFDRVAEEASNAWNVGQTFARVADKNPLSPGLQRILAPYSGHLCTAHGYELNQGEIRAVSDRLSQVEVIRNDYEGPRDRQSRKRVFVGSKVPLVAIFVALQMEREIITKRWKLNNSYPEDISRGELNGINVEVFGPNEMGRVAAAVATMKFLQGSTRPDMLIVTGIAGGFEREGVKQGDVLVATSVADLATRKIREKEKIIPEFRPRQFRTDERLSKYLNSGSFKKGVWEQSVVDEAEWPEGLRPVIRHGTIASLDEVVSSQGWIDELCIAWPKLLGVEMEAGGVCAAAEQKQLPVVVLRGVSDLADPAKSDDEWRRRAMKTVLHLLETVDYSLLLAG